MTKMEHNVVKYMTTGQSRYSFN